MGEINRRNHALNEKLYAESIEKSVSGDPLPVNEYWEEKFKERRRLECDSQPTFQNAHAVAFVLFGLISLTIGYLVYRRYRSQRNADNPQGEIELKIIPALQF